jgi:hypothetical protein
MSLTRTTKLEAVNTMLSVIGEAPVNSLESTSKTSDVIMAEKLLNEVSREVQASGWHFNIEKDVEISPDSNNNILIPTSAARVDVEPDNAKDKEYVQRGSKIYNKSDKTFVITSALKCTIIYMLSWEDLPQSARQYIMIRASRKFQDRVVGSEKHHGFNQVDEYQSLIALREAEAEGGDYTIFDHYDVYRVIDRGNVRNRIT